MNRDRDALYAAQSDKNLLNQSVPLGFAALDSDRQLHELTVDDKFVGGELHLRDGAKNNEALSAPRNKDSNDLVAGLDPNR